MESLLTGLLLLVSTHYLLVDAQADGVSFSLRGESYSHNDLVNIEGIGTGDNGLIAATTYRPCCTGTGNWFLPGASTALSSQVAQSFYQSRSANGELVLNRGDFVPNTAGLFRVNIPNTSGGLTDVYIGLYTNTGGEPTVTSLTYNASTLTLTCLSSGGPATTVVWRRNCSPLTIGTPSQSLTDSIAGAYTSTLTLLTPAKDGVYSCTVENRRGRSSSTVTVGAVTFDVTITPSEATPIAGRLLTLTCSHNSSEDPASVSFQWLDTQGTPISNDSTLTFDTLRESQREYYCVVTVGTEVSCGEYYSNVQVPVFGVGISDVSGTVSMAITLTCTFSDSSVTMAMYYFFKRGVSVGSSSTHMYTIPMARVSDAGNDYTCQVVISLDYLDLSSPLTLSSNQPATLSLKSPSSPTTPMSLTVSMVNHQSASFEWVVMTVAYDNESYIVTYGLDSNDLSIFSATQPGSSDISLTNSVYSISVGGLQVKTRYYYRVVSTNSAGSTQSELATFNTTGVGPTAPLSLSYIMTTPTNHTFSWLLPNDTDVTVNQYTLTCQGTLRNGDPLDTVIIVTVMTSVNSDLVPWANYTCFVVASDKDGSSPSSNKISFITPETAPSGPPGNFLVGLNPTGGMIPFTWTSPPSNQRNGFIITYSLECSAGPTDTVVTVFPPSPSNQYTAINYSALTTYTCSVRARNSKGEGPPATLDVTTGEDVPGAPPMSFTATARTDGTVLFNWSPPPLAQQNGVLTDYILTCTPPLSFNYGPNEVGGTGEGFSPATRYTCTLTASTAIGDGPSASVTVVTFPSIPAVSVISLSSTQLGVNWTTPLNALITEHIIYRDGVEFGRSQGSEFIISGLRPYTEHNVGVSASNEAGEGSVSEGQIVRTLEDLPGRVECAPRWVSSSSTFVTVRWAPPTQENGITLAYHIRLVRYGNSDSTPLAEANMTSSDREVTLTPRDDLVGGVPYTVQVVAENSIGRSTEICQSIDFIAQLEPPSPSSLGVSRTVDTITLSWDVPTLLEARGYVSYTVTFGPSVGARRRRQTPDECSLSPCNVPVERGGVVISGLDPGTNYDLTVTPSNEDNITGVAATATAPTTVNTQPTNPPPTCSDLIALTNGMISYNMGPASSPRPVNTVATYTCDTGYTLDGGTTRTCGSSGVWSGSAPTCQPICSDSPSLPNGVISYNGGSTDIRPINTIATHSCNTGYTLNGDSVRVCQNDRTWNGSPPTCQVSCGPPPSITNGSPETPTSTIIGGEATYICDTGLILIGSDTITCLSTGNWSSSPSCQIPPPVYLSLSSTNYLSGLSEIPLSSVGEGSGLVCHTDRAGCCEGGTGDWYYPNGSIVMEDGVLYVSRGQMSVSLMMSGTATAAGGLYCCVVPTSGGMSTACIVLASTKERFLCQCDSTGAVVGGVMALVAMVVIAVTVVMVTYLVLRYKRGGKMTVPRDIPLTDQGQSATATYETDPATYEEIPASREVKDDYSYSQNDAYLTVSGSEAEGIYDN
ncbi:receptor-type tyrosine-protein phosphatase delta-like isoform X3 [Halichondria panicea]|uniref:receptor-type tyrosine-protein phosphatase delta-like isoform X3 n=1 Tax=Halichondria panicea TaxID=6063 RepID=UPI00312B36DB